MNNDKYNENRENDNNRPNYARKPKLKNIIKNIVFTAMVGLALYGAGKGIEVGVKFVKNEIDHLNNPYVYSEATKIVVIPPKQGLTYAAYEIEGVDDSVDARIVVDHIEHMKENEEMLKSHKGVVPVGAGIAVPVSMERNDD